MGIKVKGISQKLSRALRENWIWVNAEEVPKMTEVLREVMAI